MLTIKKSYVDDFDLTVFTVFGLVEPTRMLQEIKWFYNSKASKNVLLDFRGANLTSLLSSDIENFTRPNKNNCDKRVGGKTCIVTSSDLAYGLARMYSALKESQNLPYETKPFKDMESALKWLNGEGLVDGFATKRYAHNKKAHRALQKSLTH
jgi:hypothetical protein